MKIDQSGETEWERIFEGYGTGEAGIQTSDGGYLIVGAFKTGDEVRNKKNHVHPVNQEKKVWDCVI